jgi:hypothetical protein
MQAEKALVQLGLFSSPVTTSLSLKLAVRRDETICRIRYNSTTSSGAK